MSERQAQTYQNQTGCGTLLKHPTGINGGYSRKPAQPVNQLDCGGKCR